MRLRFSSPRQRLFLALSVVVALTIVTGGSAGVLLSTRGAHASPTKLNQLDTIFYKYYGEGSGRDDGQYDDNNPDVGAALQRAGDAAYPATSVGADQILAARDAHNNLIANWGAQGGNSWQLAGPTTVTQDGPATYTGNPFNVAGRTTALGIGSTCQPGACRLYVGAAGGGVWRTNDALAATPAWKSVTNGLFTNAIGSIWVDPRNGDHVLVGTGEENGSSDSEAGLGLYESWNGGNGWALLPGSLAVAKGRAIGAVAVDPTNPAHIYIGTDVARHGSSSVNGGRFTPPSAPQVGLYESRNGGLSFSLAFSQPSDAVNPASPNGSDFFRGGVSKILFDSTTTGRIYFSMFDYGLFRSDGKGGYEQVFASAGGGSVANSSTSRTEFALAPINGSHLRVYVGDIGGGSDVGQLYRVDDANVPAAALTAAGKNPGWTPLSSPVKGTPGYASYNFCEGQCSYDMFVASPAGKPDNVWIGGSMAYSELAAFGASAQPSNGRAVQRSTNAGVGFTDMTNDQKPNGMHPDQHAIAFDPQNPDIAFTGSDGGLVRTSGSFGPDPIGCDQRNVTGADLADCQQWLAAIPTQIFNLNAGLATLQFQSVSVNPQNANDVQGGTQDNGTQLNYGSNTTWHETVGGDGGQSGYNVANPTIRFHSYYGPSHDISFDNGSPLSWDWIADKLQASGEAASFYTPIIADPKAAGTMFDGLQHVWRTQDNAGDQASLDKYCNEFTGQYNPAVYTCGDWVPLGGAQGANTPGDLTGAVYGADKGGSYVVAVARTASNTGTMWAGTRRGRLFITTNADAADPNAVTYTRLDSASTPTRFISGIAVDPANPNHAYVSFSGYDAYARQAGTATGHVFDVVYNPATKQATWTDISKNVGDQPVTGIAYDSVAHTLYLATDYTVLKQSRSGDWRIAATGLPLVAVYGLTLDAKAGVLYAATHGRGAYRLTLR